MGGQSREVPTLLSTLRCRMRGAEPPTALPSTFPTCATYSYVGPIPPQKRSTTHGAIPTAGLARHQLQVESPLVQDLNKHPRLVSRSIRLRSMPAILRLVIVTLLARVSTRRHIIRVRTPMS